MELSQVKVKPNKIVLWLGTILMELNNFYLDKSKTKKSRILQIENEFLKEMGKISPNAVKSAQEWTDLYLHLQYHTYCMDHICIVV